MSLRKRCNLSASACRLNGSDCVTLYMHLRCSLGCDVLGSSGRRGITISTDARRLHVPVQSHWSIHRHNPANIRRHDTGDSERTASRCVCGWAGLRCAGVSLAKCIMSVDCDQCPTDNPVNDQRLAATTLNTATTTTQCVRLSVTNPIRVDQPVSLLPPASRPSSRRVSADKL